jgi:hypothetical protein
LKNNKEKIGYYLLAIISLISIIIVLIIPPVEQDISYHNFSDKIDMNGVSNFWNVLSNLPFLIVGIYGILNLNRFEKIKTQISVFFTGVALVALGSGYYHYSPDNNTLIWDRLPMTIAFTALMSIVISEFINLKKGKQLLIPLIILGIISIMYWIYFNDLRLYVLIQFYPMIAIPIVLILFKQNISDTIAYWCLLASYILAKLFENYDYEIHNTLKIISGHSLKHIMASIGILLFIIYHKDKNYYQQHL